MLQIHEKQKNKSQLSGDNEALPTGTDMAPAE